ncbi:MAG: hypothetical protein AAF360_13300 [Pseudomonadota bacterium]
MAKPNKRKQKQAIAKADATPTAEESRRGFFQRIRAYAIGGAVIAGGGVWGASYFEAMAAEHDLNRIGKGTPKVVQIHDPQCPRCTALQREARAAVEDVDSGDICLLVANIRTAKGRDFAAVHGVGSVTLVLMDGEGRVVEILQGNRQRRELSLRFQELARV